MQLNNFLHLLYSVPVIINHRETADAENNRDKKMWESRYGREDIVIN